MRGRQRRAALAPLVMAALVTAAATACAPPLRDLGPLPPRFTGPPLTADTVVSEMTSVLAAEGVTVKREPSDVLGYCMERLSGRHAPQTVEAAVKAAVARARSEHGWQDAPVTGSETITLKKSNWTVLVGFNDEPAEGIQAPVSLSLTCVDGGAPTAPATPTGPAFTPVPASS
ncbi:hypothetical protein ACTVZO_36430 [Streptomyces sp. IBSNAI002]|uniref:hypothetical protein n=1 Tax=Streptomyces sp. IBSNAI002 TaxID=3457500 RepID=UPI003FD5D12E